MEILGAINLGKEIKLSKLLRRASSSSLKRYFRANSTGSVVNRRFSETNDNARTRSFRQENSAISRARIDREVLFSNACLYASEFCGKTRY